jgi:heme oxygenase
MKRRPRHSELYAATAEIHAATEEAVERAGYFADRPHYADYLGRMYVFYRRFVTEAVASHGREQVERWRIPSRVSWLELDLAALDATASPAVPSSERRLDKLDLRLPAALLGGLYVLVGSTLGAPLLLERTAHLELPAACGRAYLSGVAGERVWPRFLETLEAEPSDAGPALVGGAVTTFECLLAHLAGAPS